LFCSRILELAAKGGHGRPADGDERAEIWKTGIRIRVESGRDGLGRLRHGSGPFNHGRRGS
jgi:hypothetical protein